MKHKYAVQILWSEEDGAYIASTAELPGGIADGKTPEEALSNLDGVIQEWMEVAAEEKRQIPPPMTAQDMERMHLKSQADLQAHIHHQIESAVEGVLRKLAALSSRSQSQFYVRGNFPPESEFEPAGGARRR